MASDKSAHLLGCVDLTPPALASVSKAEDPATAFVQYLAESPRPRHRFEHERKDEILAFCREHYQAWREFDYAPAEKIAAFSIEQAQKPRALSGIAALGQAWWAGNDPKWGAAFERFYRAVPTGEMFNWGEFNGSQGALELNAYFLLLDCPGFSSQGRIAFLDHLHTLTGNAWDTHTSKWQQISLGPEGHNWYLHGMHMLPFVGLLFPEFKRADFFFRTGWSVVEEHVRGHYKADGGARETCVGYQAGSMLVLWSLYALACRNGVSVSPGFTERLLKATHFLLRLMSPAGGLPSFGDGGHSPGGLTGLAAVAAALTGDRECKWYAEYCREQCPGIKAETPGQIPLSAFWAVGLEGAAAYAETAPK